MNQYLILVQNNVFSACGEKETMNLQIIPSIFRLADYLIDWNLRLMVLQTFLSYLFGSLMSDWHHQTAHTHACLGATDAIARVDRQIGAQANRGLRKIEKKGSPLSQISQSGQTKSNDEAENIPNGEVVFPRFFLSAIENDGCLFCGAND
jgi:hypothetical protein